MAKCIYCKEHSKDQYRCEITGVVRNKPCIEYKDLYYRDKIKNIPCKHLKVSLFGRISDWIYQYLDMKV